jgi:DNA topoisomerase-1
MRPKEALVGHKVVIVESPTKAKTLRKFLGTEFQILASVGHVIDLPASKLGVDLENDFKPQYITIRGKEKILKELKKAAHGADKVFLATDPDREGEAISWHLARALKLRTNAKLRVLIPEFTKGVVQHAIKHPIRLDAAKVDSQQARRVLDRIVGYKISPLLWKKVQSGLSAGRVQSVALKLIAEREKEIKAFTPEEFWTLTVDLRSARHAAADATAAPPVFSAELKKVDGKTHTLRSKGEVDGVLADLAVAAFVVARIAELKKHQRPHAPYITSTLQQASSQIYNFSTKKTMMIAQQLYEGIELGKGAVQGLITYMRTDSTRVSPEAQKAAAQYIASSLGARYVPATPPIYKAGKARVQDAHEAIRPADAHLEPRTIRAHLTPEQYKLYTLIWARFLASQMKPAEFMQRTVDIDAGRYTLRAVGREKLFDGYLKVYEAATDIAKRAKENYLPALAEKDVLSKVGEPKAEQGFTQPPPHFTEASLVKALEERGIGRPSTYATIITTLLDRAYVERQQKNLMPTELGMLVEELLVANFQRIMDVDFTAGLEDELDAIEAGKCRWQQVLQRFYDDFKLALATAETKMRDLRREFEPTDLVCDLVGEDGKPCGKPMIIRRGRYGRFIACSGWPQCRNTRELPRNGNGDGSTAPVEEVTEICEKCGAKMQLRRGRFGPFIACTKWPECKSTKPVLTKLGIPCPEKGCKGEIVSRMSRRRRVFYGCSEYPNCKFTSWVRLAKGSCPRCQGYLVERRSRNVLQLIACAKKECGWTAPPPAEGSEAAGAESPTVETGSGKDAV